VYVSRRGGVTAAYPNWKKDHARIQLRYKGYEIFNDLQIFVEMKNDYLFLKKNLPKSIKLQKKFLKNS